MAILVTGAAGFIGYHVSQALIDRGEQVIGLDMMNHYYDVRLKEARLTRLQGNKNFSFVKLDIAQKDDVLHFFKQHSQIDRIVHLAAQAGVRYSLSHPFAYVDANVTGHLAMLEGCRLLPNLKHMVYASSSSVYGANSKLPFAEDDRTDHPISLYAATKKSCELMSECHHYLYKLPLTGLRFFTVYGPWGRPDMSAFIFTKAILEGQKISVFNYGQMRRNFTYIDDIVQGTVECLLRLSWDGTSIPRHRVYNIGNDKSEALLDFISALESIIGIKADKHLEDMQPGDVPETIADINKARQDFEFAPKTNIDMGLKKFVDWYKNYHGYE